MEDESGSVLTDPHKVRQCVETLVPLLLDCWVETGITSLADSGLFIFSFLFFFLFLIAPFGEEMFLSKHLG